jgi:ketosteroid isomerase-like protein
VNPVVIADQGLQRGGYPLSVKGAGVVHRGEVNPVFGPVVQRLNTARSFADKKGGVEWANTIHAVRSATPSWNADARKNRSSGILPHHSLTWSSSAILAASASVHGIDHEPERIRHVAADPARSLEPAWGRSQPRRVCNDPRVPSLADDRDAIRDLIARYCLAVDTGAVDEIVGSYTDDGEFHGAGVDLAGRQALQEYFGVLAVTGLHRIAANFIIDVDGDTARCQSSVLLYGGDALVASGRTVDTLRRVGRAWRVACRVYTPDGAS